MQMRDALQARIPSFAALLERPSDQTGASAERLAGELGLEPRMTVPKTAVLPLHHSPAGMAASDVGRLGGRDSAPPRASQRPAGCRPCGPPLYSALPISECGSVW